MLKTKEISVLSEIIENKPVLDIIKFFKNDNRSSIK